MHMYTSHNKYPNAAAAQTALQHVLSGITLMVRCVHAGDPESKDEVEADTSGDETDPVDSGHKARDEMFAAVASIRVGY